MNHSAAELDQTDEDILNEVSDETLEAGGRLHRGPIHDDCWTNDHDGGMLLTWGTNAGPAADQSFPRVEQS